MKTVIGAGGICFVVVFLLKAAFDKLSDGVVSIPSALLMAAVASAIAVIMEVTRKPNAKKQKQANAEDITVTHKKRNKKKRKKQSGKK